MRAGDGVEVADDGHGNVTTVVIFDVEGGG